MAVLFEQFRKPPKVQAAADLIPSSGGTITKVEATGLCRSDWHSWMEHHANTACSMCLAMELAGAISTLGSQVTRWHIGDRVTVPFVGGCRHCFECNSNNHQVCGHQFQPGFTT